VLPYRLGSDLYLAVPQLAEDEPNQPAQMNAGNSDIDMIVYRWADGCFREAARLPVPGGEDALIFAIEQDLFLAVASVRTGSGPYDLNALSRIFRLEDDAWKEVQSVPSFAAKQWHHFSFDGRHFLALAQGVTLPTAIPRHPRESRILEYRDGRFEDFQVLAGCWGYNWAYFEIEGNRFLGYADHSGPSLIYRWGGERFIEFQTLGDHGGRAFQYFERDGQSWLAFAVIDGDTILYRWDDRTFVVHQRLGGPGGREFELIRSGADLYLVRICFIEGIPSNPKTDLTSQLYRWQPGGFELADEFPTFGGTDAAAFEADGKRFLAVSNSLTADVRFRQDSAIYELNL
jgi:hypothetical protein